MELQEALEIVRRLADGLHPTTGQSLSDTACINIHRLCVRYSMRPMHLSVRTEGTARVFPRRKTQAKPWSEEQDARNPRVSS